ncbi:MAG: ACT domain-containing protein [Phycisphaerae bacterium]|nr:ACT domain-containing protein [Phycisphaerae bacterium]
MARSDKGKPATPDSPLCILTVIGKDCVGIIAKVSSVMAKANINIIDVSQKIMDQYFVMTMGCDISKTTASMKEIQAKLDRLATALGLQITFQNERIFKMMHRI